MGDDFLYGTRKYREVHYILYVSHVVFVRLFEQAEQRSFVPPIMMIERKKSLVTYLLPHQRGNTAGPLQIHLSERAETMLRCRHCCCGYRHTIAQMRMTQLR